MSQIHPGAASIQATTPKTMTDPTCNTRLQMKHASAIFADSTSLDT